MRVTWWNKSANFKGGFGIKRKDFDWINKDKEFDPTTNQNGSSISYTNLMWMSPYLPTLSNTQEKQENNGCSYVDLILNNERDCEIRA